ncbi:MAG: hypothetical protein RMM58_01370 [Chloroflexota bacterium]|nr:hypothetical protein [Dehalococcoidia bacterium]MDW8252509.1 hypothetical protein [Chloroflexota bacterium]
MPRTLLLLAVLLLTLAPQAQAAPPAQSAAQLKRAALARLRESSSAPAPVRTDIVRVLGNWALVRFQPKPGQADPSLVILQRKNGVWNVVAGPGTAFPPDLSLPEQWPEELFSFSGLYGSPAIPPEDISPGTVPHWIAEGTNIAFRFPIDASAALRDGSIVITGPPAAPYEILLTPLAATVGSALDEWAFDQMQTRPNPATLAAEYFPSPTANIFLIEAVSGPTVARDYFVAAKAGGQVWMVHVTLPRSERSRTALTPAERAVSLILQTLLIGPGAVIRPQSTYLDPITGYRFQYPEDWTIVFSDGAGATVAAPGRVGPTSRSVAIAPTGAVTMAEAERRTIDSVGQDVRPVGTTTFGGLQVRRYQGMSAQTGSPTWGYLIQISPEQVLSALVRNDRAGPDGNPEAGFPIVASITPLR